MRRIKLDILIMLIMLFVCAYFFVDIIIFPLLLDKKNEEGRGGLI